MKVICASPFATGTCNLDYVASVAALFKSLSARGAAFDYFHVRSADIAFNRNLIAQHFLAVPDATHLVMIDTDMRIEARVFDHFLASGHDFMGAIYARRRLDLDKFYDLAKTGKDITTAKALASDFIVTFPSEQVSFANHFVPVSGIGMGCVMIARSVFEKIEAKGLAPMVKSAMGDQVGMGDKYHDFFGLIHGDDGGYMSEDYSFCARANQTGDIDIMGYIGPGVHHTGDFNYSAPYEKVLQDLM